MSANQLKYRLSLSNYFCSGPHFFDEDLQKKPNVRKCAELPYQQTQTAILSLEKDLWDDITNTLCDLDFIQAKACAKMTYDLVKDFNNVLDTIPDNAENILQEKARQARMEKYTRNLISCAKGEINVYELEIPKRISPWSKEKIDTEIERIKANPTRLDKLKDFINYIGEEGANLQKFAGEFCHFATQQACNLNDYGIVSQTAQQKDLIVLKTLFLLNKFSRPVWNPLPVVLKVLKGHSDSVTSVSMTPDGKFALSASRDKTCIFWNLKTGQKLSVLKGHTDKVTSVSLTPDCKYAFTGSFDMTCIIWEIETGEALKTFRGHSGPVLSVALTPDAKYAVSGSLDDTCIIWDIVNGGKLKTLNLNSDIPYYGGATAVCISLKGDYVLSGSRDFPYNIILWESLTGRRLKVFQGHKKEITSLHLDPDGKIAISGSLDKAHILWDLEKGEIVKAIEDYSVGYNEVTPDGKYAISCSGDDCKFLDLEYGHVSQMLQGHSRSFSILSVSADEKHVVSGSDDETCILWDMQTGMLLKTVTGFMGKTSLILTRDGKKAIVYAEYDRKLTIWDLNNGSTYEILTDHSGGIKSACLLPDGIHIISVSLGRFCLINEIDSERTIRSIIHQKGRFDILNVTPDGRYAISNTFDTNCIILDLESGELINTFTGHNEFISFVAIMPDGKCAISGSVYDTSMLWCLGNCKTLKPLGKENDKIESILITPDGKKAVSRSMNQECVVWDLKTGLAEQTLSVHDFENDMIAITADGKNVISISYDGNCVIWNLKSGKILKRFVGHHLFESMVLFSNGIIIGESTGRIITINISKEIFITGPIITTLKYLWDFKDHCFKQPSADCPQCGCRFSPPAFVVTTIENITTKADLRSDQSPCLELPDEAWEDPGLLGNCPHCGAALKFNPFIAGGDN